MVKMVDKRNCLSKVVRQRERVRFVKFIFQNLWDNQSYLFIHYENIPLTHKISNYFQSIVIYKYYTLALSEFAKIVQKARGNSKTSFRERLFETVEYVIQIFQSCKRDPSNILPISMACSYDYFLGMGRSQLVYFLQVRGLA